MTTPMDEMDHSVSELRAQRRERGSIFRSDRNNLCVFDPAAAQRANHLNFHDLTLPDRLADLLRGRASTPVSWREVRGAWAPQLRRLTEAQHVEQLAARMRGLLDDRRGRPLDLMWAAQEVCTRSLLPAVIAGLSDADTERVLSDQTMKLERLLAPKAAPPSLWKTVRRTLTQIGAGLVARRELGGRAAGRRPRRLDLTDPLVDMLPGMGMDRASYAVTTVLTAIAGPPGAVAACLLYELTHRPDWAGRLTDELSALSLSALCAAPARAAPVTQRFVKETLRRWSAPSVINRVARAPIDLGEARVEAGEMYQVSSYILHHDPQHWNDPDTFDPDRWLEEVDHGGYYVPFGWSPTACIGATLGTIQLTLLCHLVCTSHRIHLSSPDTSRVVQGAVPLPLHFRGTIERR